MRKISRKRKLCIFTLSLAFCLLSLAGCTQAEDGHDTWIQEENVSSDENAVTGKVMKVSENTILVLLDDKNSSGLANFGISEVSFYDQDGKKMEGTDLRPGMFISLSTTPDGVLLERYPLGITGVQEVCVLEQQNDVAGLYLDILKEIYCKDTEPDSGVSTVALDLTEAENLSDQEKAAVRYFFENELMNEERSPADREGKNRNVILSTWEELAEQGLIDKKELYFTEGVLITIKAKEVKNNRFRFSVKKWRSGRSAVGYDSCKGTFKNGVGTFRLGGPWMA